MLVLRGIRRRGVSGRYHSVAEDCALYEACVSPGMRANSSICGVFTSSWHVEWFWAVVYLWQDCRKSYVARVDILPRSLLRAQGGRRSKDFRVFDNKQTKPKTREMGHPQYKTDLKKSPHVAPFHLIFGQDRQFCLCQ